MRRESPFWVYENQAQGVIEHFRSIAPTRPPNRTEYLSYLNRIEERLYKGVRVHSVSRTEVAFHFPGRRLNEFVFGEDSILWTWDIGGGARFNSIRKSVKLYMSGGNSFLELKISEFAGKGELEPFETVRIVIGNEPTATVSQYGIPRTVLLEQAISLFPKPK